MLRTEPAPKTSSSERLSPLALGLGNNRAVLQISVRPYRITYLKGSQMMNCLPAARRSAALEIPELAQLLDAARALAAALYLLPAALES